MERSSHPLSPLGQRFIVAGLAWVSLSLLALMLFLVAQSTGNVDARDHRDIDSFLIFSTVLFLAALVAGILEYNLERAK